MHEYGLAARDQDGVRLAQPGGEVASDAPTAEADPSPEPLLSTWRSRAAARTALSPWGVLDHLLEAELFRYEGMSGTSAGAIDAVVLASGWLAGGAAGARANLAALWREVAEIACPRHRSGLPHTALDATTQLLSPYQQ
jgi:NTE family protein